MCYRQCVKLLLVMLLAACWGSAPSTPPSNAAAPRARVAGVDTIPFTGNAAARVKIISFYNYQCGHCVTFEPILDNIASKYGNRIVIYYRSLRLPAFHDNDVPHLAALAAHRQGQFIAMHRALFAAGAFDPESVRGYAQKLGLDLERFERDLADPKLRARITEDTAAAEAADVAYVPYLIIDGTPYEGDREVGPLTTAIDAALAR
ncbi:MAG: thioredoxin domain-containing protein [Deltaproteobacteria bacterium]|nr:thioredoxin domain-containing protein [Deltaproteobacteria bacterium]